MGKIASSLSDKVIFTSDNPRHENPLDIINQMRDGVNDIDLNKVDYEIDREKAIQKACLKARINDVILVAGKGHEKYQVHGDLKIDFNDKEILIKSLKTKL